MRGTPLRYGSEDEKPAICDMRGFLNTVGIPKWNAQGVIPPIDVLSPTSATRSPYRVSLTDLILRFNTSATRGAVLNGYLRFRSALHGIGIVDGFQWVDGSFVEDIETLDARSPKDVDVVTFYHLPPGTTQASILAFAPELFDHDEAKRTYHVDSYFQGLGSASERLVQASAYWHSVWSHRRDQAWKGYLEVALNPVDDAAARALLISAPITGIAP